MFIRRIYPKLRCTLRSYARSIKLTIDRIRSRESSKLAVKSALSCAEAYYRNEPEFASEIDRFAKLFSFEFADTPESSIRSSGYVIDTLEAAVWCLLNTEDYHDCVLKAVNLGSDTDTVAAVAGGLAMCTG